MGYFGRANVHETMQGMLWSGRCLCRPIAISRLIDELRLLGEGTPRPIDEV